MKTIISTLVLILSLMTTAYAAVTEVDIRENAPDRYTVVPGDTLWGIAAKYLKSPWKWPELWKANKERVRNPNLIYPGEVLVLDRSGANVVLRLETVTLAPQVRTEALPPDPIPTVPLTAIEPFLSQPRVVGEDTLAKAPVVVALQENRIAIGSGTLFYARGIAPEIDYWQLLRRGQKLVDPDNKETLGWLAVYLGDARVVGRGSVNTMQMTSSKKEVYFGDSLLPAPRQELADNFYPRAPGKPINGRVVYTYDSLYETGSTGIVVLWRGARDGIEVGNVLALRRNQAVRNYLRQAPLYGREGPSGDPTLNPYKSVPLTGRDTPLYGYYGPSSKQFTDPAVTVPLDQLPDFRYGLVMVFRVFDKTSFALVMQSDTQVDLYDIVTNP